MAPPRGPRFPLGKLPALPRTTRRAPRSTPFLNIGETDLGDYYPAHGEKLTPGVGVELPGMGERGRACGDKVELVCQDCGHRYFISHSCMDRRCPRCGMAWARGEAAVAADRVLAHRGRHRLVHAIVSFPGAPEDIFRKRPTAIEIAKRHGIGGGAVIGHSWRVDANVEWSDSDLVSDGYVHYHIVGALTRTDERFLPAVEGAPYVFKVIKKNDTYYLKNRSIKRIIRYCLEHATIAFRKHALSWFGTWWKREDGSREPALGGEVHAQRFECPACGSARVALAVHVPRFVRSVQLVFDVEGDGTAREPRKPRVEVRKTWRRRRKTREC